MKKFLIISILLLSVIDSHGRIFTSMDDRTVEAEIKSYDETSNIVELKRNNGKLFKVNANIFSKNDQLFIKDFAKIESFMDEKLFYLEFSEQIIERIKKEDTVYFASGEVISYEILVKNRSKYSFEDIVINYKIFYEDEEFNRDTRKKETRVESKRGNYSIQNLLSKTEKVFDTSEIVLMKTEFNSDYYLVGGGNPDTRDSLIGIWVKVSVKDTGKNIYTQNFSLPLSIQEKYTW
ncbi:MAG: hypothetical protein ACJ0BW_00110 [Pontiellaceae bacterium]